MRRVLVAHVAVILVVLAVILGPVQSVGATAQYFQDREVILNQGSYIYFTRVRTISYSPYGIAFAKDNGPAMNMKWVYEGSTSGGNEVYIPNADPIGFVFLKANGTGPFSLRWNWAIKGLGNDVDNSFAGTLDWDGYYG